MTTKTNKPDKDDFTVYGVDGAVWVKCDICRERHNFGQGIFPSSINKWVKTHRKEGCKWTD